MLDNGIVSDDGWICTDDLTKDLGVRIGQLEKGLKVRVSEKKTRRLTERKTYF